MLVATDRNQRFDARRHAGFDVLGAEVAGVSQQCLGRAPPGGQRLQRRQRRLHLLLIVAGLGDILCEDQHRLGVDHGLTVVALIKAAAGYLHDARVFVGQINLIVGAWTGLRRLGRLAAGLLAGGLLLGFALGQLGLVLGLFKLVAGLGTRFDHR